jgi:hypothetical protein
MAPRVWKEREKDSLRKVISAKEGFYATEAVRILKVEGVDYEQLRRLHRLVAPTEARAAGARWVRFTEEDLVAAAVAIELLGGPGAFGQGRRLPWQAVEKACEMLRNHYGVARPLHDARLSREGNRIVAHHEGLVFEPVTGQSVLDSVEAGMRAYSRTTPFKGRPKGDAPVQVLARLRDRKPARRARSQEAGTVVLVIESLRGGDE